MIQNVVADMFLFVVQLIQIFSDAILQNVLKKHTKRTITFIYTNLENKNLSKYFTLKKKQTNNQINKQKETIE